MYCLHINAVARCNLYLKKLNYRAEPLVEKTGPLQSSVQLSFV